MESYEIKIFPLAQVDALDLAEYLNSRSPEDAAQLFELFMLKLEKLVKNPQSSALARDTQLRLRGYRTLQEDVYTFFLVIRGYTIELRRILFSKRQFEWML